MARATAMDEARVAALKAAASVAAFNYHLPPPLARPTHRFRLSDRVCCNRGASGWMVGTVVTIDEPARDHEGNAIEGEEAQDQSGYSVSLSANGTVLAVGAPFHGCTEIDCGNSWRAGRTRAFRYDGSDWSPMGAAIYGEVMVMMMVMMMVMVMMRRRRRRRRGTIIFIITTIIIIRRLAT